MKKLPANAALIALGAVIGLVIGELGLRLWRGGVFDFSNRVETYQKTRSLYAIRPVVHDPALGWIPKPNAHFEMYDWNALLTHGPDGIRTNGADFPKGGPVILATGDSFTFGDGVSDGETWPAALERLLGIRVLNGGVSGYGFDQTVLRTEQLLAHYGANLVLVGFIADDIKRCGLSVRTQLAKPYFTVENERLILQQVPVPKLAVKPGIGVTRRIFGYSALANAVAGALFPDDWYGGGNVAVDNDPEEVACRLTKRLAELGKARGIPIVVVAQYSRPQPRAAERQATEALLVCAEKAGLYRFDTAVIFDDIKRTAGPAAVEKLFPGHLSAEGNARVAAALAEFFRQTFRLQAVRD